MPIRSVMVTDNNKIIIKKIIKQIIYLPTYVIVVIGVHDVRHIGKMHIS